MGASQNAGPAEVLRALWQRILSRARDLRNAGRADGNFAIRKYCSLSCANSTGAAAKPTFHFRARKSLKPQCEACGIRRHPHAHHVDGDISNNDPSNIQTLCTHCHGFWHNMLKRCGLPVAHRMPRLCDF